jgi:hypothetical protein
VRTAAASAALLFAACACTADAPAGRPLTPEEAGKHVGERVTVEMRVVATKDRLEKRKEIYLDSTADHTDPKNLAVVITAAGAGRLKEAGVDNPAAHFKGKTIRVTGTVTLKDREPRIEVNESSQIRAVGKKD